MKIKNSAKFTLGIIDLVCGIGLTVACVAMQREQRLVYTIFPILCGIFSLLDSIESKKQRQKREKELKKFFGGDNDDQP